MPERQVSLTNLRIGAHIGGYLLLSWTLLATALSLTHLTVVGDTLTSFGYPPWVMTAGLAGVAATQIWGNVLRSRRILIPADLLGGLTCMAGGALSAYATTHGDNAAILASLWAFAACQFLLHAVMLKHR